MKFITKIKQLLGSIRFYIVTFAWLADYLAEIQSAGFDVVILFNQISLWLGSVVAIGTIDSIATKLRNGNKNNVQ